MYVDLVSGTRFSAHQEMCNHIESMTDTVVDFRFRGRNNFFLMESDSPKGLSRYIMYVFLVNLNDTGWAMKTVSEHESIPNLDCPMALIRQSNEQDPVAVAWRKMVRDAYELHSLEQASVSNEKTPSCTCRLLITNDKKHSQAR